jgi:DNA polymerase I-like protein with 3'-5' exonuclease and polymerase domains
MTDDIKFYGLDLETFGDLQEYALQAYRAARGQAGIRAISVSDGTNTLGLLNPEITKLTTILRSLKGKYVVGWNVCFDISWLYAVGVPAEAVEAINWVDGMLIWMHTVRTPEAENGPRKSYSLKAAMLEYFPDDAGFKDFEDFQTDTPEGLQKLLHRNKEDARYTVKLADMFWSQLGPKQRRAALLEARCIPMVALTYNQGIQIDSDALGLLRTELESAGADAYADLKAHYPEIDTVNLGSPKQIGNLLYKVWGLHPPRQTASGADSTDKFALHALAETYPQARLLRDYRESQYNLAKYVTATEAAVEYNGDGAVRPQAKIFGTYTGRMTYYSKQKAPKKKP